MIAGYYFINPDPRFPTDIDQAQAEEQKKIEETRRKKKEEAEGIKANKIKDTAEARRKLAEAKTRHQSKIDKLVAATKSDIKASRLTSPSRNNAFERIQQLTILEPDHEEIPLLKAQIINRYIQLSKQASDNFSFTLAADYLDRAGKIGAHSPALKRARTYFDSALNEHKKQLAAEKRKREAQAEKERLAVLAAKRNKPLSTFQNTMSLGSKAPKMVVIPAGSFLMGSPDSEYGRHNNEGPQRRVFIESFAVGKTEVTFEEYDRFTQATSRKKQYDGGWGRDKRPVNFVSWENAQAYAQWLSEQTGHKYRLPTEAEWEYATRAGSTTRYSWGNEIDCSKARYGFYSDVCDKKRSTDLVASFASNPFGLFDVNGNVWEWTQDCWHDNYNNAPEDGSVWETEDEGDCIRRVGRGGGWNSIPQILRSAYRDWNDADEEIYNQGFRLARTL